MIELSILSAFLTCLTSLILFRPLAIKFGLVDYPTERKNLVGNIGFSKKLILLLTLSFGLVILLLGIFIENNFPDLCFLVFLILFLFYLSLRMYNNSH